MTRASLRKLADTRLPWLASHYRLIRDQWRASRWPVSAVPQGLQVIAPPGMVASRAAAGELDNLLELLADTDVFIDAGAHCGLFTLTARRSGVAGVAIEPNRENFNVLLLNLRANQFTDVEALHLALSESVDVLPLFGGLEGASLNRMWGGIASTYSRLVPVNTMDNLFGDRFAGKRLLVKVDVEGNEYSVVRGAGRLLCRTPAPVWIIEHGFTENFSGLINPRFRDLFGLFWEKGYRCYTADAARRSVSEADVNRWLASGERDFGSLNYVFCRREG